MTHGNLLSLLSALDWKLLTLTWKSTWTELLEKFKNDLKALKLSLISETLQNQLILKAKNTDSKYETVKQKSKKQNYQS